MSFYKPNRSCTCARCRTRGLMGAGILITLGVLFLLSEMWYLSFDETWPVLLIVVGVFMYLSHSASTEGHIDPYGARQATQPPNGQNDPEVRF